MAFSASTGASAPVTRLAPQTQDERRAQREALRASLAQDCVSWCIHKTFGTVSYAVGTRQQLQDEGLLAPDAPLPIDAKEHLTWVQGPLEYTLHRLPRSRLKEFGRTGEQWMVRVWPAKRESFMDLALSQKLQEIQDLMNPKPARPEGDIDALRRMNGDVQFQKHYRALLDTVFLPRGRRAHKVAA